VLVKQAAKYSQHAHSLMSRVLCMTTWLVHVLACAQVCDLHKRMKDVDFDRLRTEIDFRCFLSACRCTPSHIASDRLAGCSAVHGRLIEPYTLTWMPQHNEVHGAIHFFRPALQEF
jgi:hypothetical protein